MPARFATTGLFRTQSHGRASRKRSAIQPPQNERGSGPTPNPASQPTLHLCRTHCPADRGVCCDTHGCYGGADWACARPDSSDCRRRSCCWCWCWRRGGGSCERCDSAHTCCGCSCHVRLCLFFGIVCFLRGADFLCPRHDSKPTPPTDAQGPVSDAAERERIFRAAATAVATRMAAASRAVPAPVPFVVQSWPAVPARLAGGGRPSDEMERAVLLHSRGTREREGSGVGVDVCPV
jgi:hypothetical protein